MPAAAAACPFHQQQHGEQQGAQGPAQGDLAPPLEFPPHASLHHKVVGLIEARLQRGGRLRRYTMAEVARHNSKDDGWVVVAGKCFDITPHVLSHPGWTSGCGTSQLLAILRTLGTDCTEEVLMVHSQRALAQFAPYLIGVVAEDEVEEAEAAADASAGGEEGRAALEAPPLAAE